MKIIVDVERQEKIIELRKNVGEMTQQILAANTAMKAQGATTAQVAASLAPMNAQLRSSIDQFKSLERAGGMSAQGLMQLSYAIDDIQYGFGAIVNNIPQVAAGLGLGQGIAGAAGIAAVMLNQLINHWGELVEKFTTGWESPAVAGLKAMEEAAKAAAEAYKSIPAPGSQVAAGAGASKVFAEGPKEAVLQAVMAKMSENGEQFAPKTAIERQRIASADAAAKSWNPMLGPKNFAADIATEERQRVANRQSAEIKKQATDLVGAATLPGGGEAQKRIAEMVPGIANQLDAISPEGQKRQKDFEKQLEVNKKVQDKIKEANAEHAKQLEKDMDAAKRAADIKEKADKDSADERRAWLDDTMKIGREQSERKAKDRIEKMEDERTALMEKKHALSQHHAAGSAGESSVQAMLMALHAENVSGVPKAQLDKLRDIDASIKDLTKKLLDARRDTAAKFK